MAKKRDAKPWQRLKVGDQVRFVAMPSEFSTPGYYVHPHTLSVYRRLIARRRPVRVFKIDEWKFPWIRCQFRRKDGRWEYHSLAINHDGLVRVQSSTAD